MYADFMKMVLEIINCLLTSGLQTNPELVYALLHRQELFTSLRNSKFRDLLDNVEVRILTSDAHV